MRVLGFIRDFLRLEVAGSALKVAVNISIGVMFEVAISAEDMLRVASGGVSTFALEGSCDMMFEVGSLGEGRLRMLLGQFLVIARVGSSPMAGCFVQNEVAEK